jgi:NAD(P)H-dependent FMN reductase
VPNSSAGPSAGRALQNELQSIFSQFQMPAYVHSDSDDSFDNRGRTDSSDDFLNFDIPTSRAGSRLRHTRGTQVRSRARRHPIEEEDDSSDY